MCKPILTGGASIWELSRSSVNFGKAFCPKIYVWKINKMPEFHVIIGRKIISGLFWGARRSVITEKPSSRKGKRATAVGVYEGPSYKWSELYCHAQHDQHQRHSGADKKIGQQLHLLFKLHIVWSVDSKETHENVCHQGSDFMAKIHQNRFQLGLCPRPRCGSLQRSPKLNFRGLTSKEREGRGRKGKDR